MVGYPLFPMAMSPLHSPPFPKNFQESMLELAGDEDDALWRGLVFSGREAILLGGGTLSP